MLRQMDLLDCLARSALARDAEYDKILDDDFGTATSGEEIYLTPFPLALGPCHMPYLYEGVCSPLYTREEWNGPHAPSHSYELNSCYANLVSSKAHLQEKFDQNKG
ncbi:hypothetical protein Tco_0311083, partial [Tanacetum coccineum]